MTARLSALALLAQTRVAGADRSGDWASVAAPTLVLTGGKSLSGFHAAAEAITAALPGLFRVRGGGRKPTSDQVSGQDSNGGTTSTDQTKWSNIVLLSVGPIRAVCQPAVPVIAARQCTRR